MKKVDEILQHIEFCINNKQFVKLENEKVELKDNSHQASEWNEVFKTTDAFLNTNGGIIIIGVYEDQKNNRYVFKGFDFRNEDKVKTIVNQFTNDEGDKKDIAENIRFGTKSFLNGQLLIIYVDPLADDEKYLFFNNEAYERLVTGDHRISDLKIQSQKEYKAELIDTRELRPVPNSSLADLDVNKLNDYIHLLNSEVKTENIKATIDEAKSFLTRNWMLREETPTTLGMLVCGKSPEVLLHWRCQVDAYVDVPGSVDVAQNKKTINDTILTLMEQSVSFVFKNIQTGVSTEKGGTKTFEYPERLIRECVNNSLAHRDYSIDQFININIVPARHIQIRNPGRFKKQLLILDLHNAIPVRRIIPGNPKANNPKLAKILSVHNKWEGKGWGMATVLGACLDNRIDMPYYIFHSWDDLSLFVPKGKLVDESMESLFESYSGYITKKLNGEEISEEQKRVLAYFYKSELLNKNERFTILLTKDNNHLRAIQSLEEAQLIYRHPVSDEINSVFVIDRNLFKKNFSDELRSLFGEHFDQLKKDYRDILGYVYECNNFSGTPYPSKNMIGNVLWLRMGNANVLEGFEDFKRRIRYVVNRLEQKKFLIRYEGKSEFMINNNFQKTAFLFNL